MAGMAIRFMAVGQVTHLAAVPGGQPLIEPGQAGRRNGRIDSTLREAHIGRFPPQFAGQITRVHRAILATYGVPGVESATALISLEDRYGMYHPPTSHNSSYWNTPRNDSMNRRFLILIALAAAIISMPMTSADAAGRGGGGHRGGFKGGGKGIKSGFGHGGFGHGGFGGGCGFGGCGVGGIGFGIGGYNDICGYAELYRQLYNNLPFYALHPPVYYSYPVPRTYGYSPFAYPPGVMTPEFAGAPQPLEIINPHVESPTAPEAKSTNGTKPDRAAATSARVEPLVVINPFVAPNQAVAQVER
jgi:hypothetical protein